MSPIIRIDDLNDPALRDYRDLTDVALRRVVEPREGLYLAESSKVIARAIESGHQPRSVLLLEKWLDELEPILAGFDVPIFVGTTRTLESVTGFTMHRGALASMARPALLPVSDVIAGTHRIVVIEDIVIRMWEPSSAQSSGLVLMPCSSLRDAQTRCIVGVFE